MKRAQQFWQAIRSKHTTLSQRRLVFSAVLLCLTPLAALAQSSSTQKTTPVPVTVTNTTANPVPTAATDTSARNIVRLVGQMGGTADNATKKYLDVAGGTGATGYLVPAGKRLVINAGSILIEGNAYPSSGLLAIASLSVSSPNAAYSVFLLLQQQPDGTYMATLPGPIYVDENQSLALVIFANQYSLNEYFLQGYLVDCGTGCTQQ